MKKHFYLLMLPIAFVFTGCDQMGVTEASNVTANQLTEQTQLMKQQLDQLKRIADALEKQSPNVTANWNGVIENYKDIPNVAGAVLVRVNSDTLTKP